MSIEIKDDLEFKVHTWLSKKIKEYFPTAWIYKPRSGSYGKKGVPDFLFCIDGYFIAIEVKRVSGKITPAQTRELEKITSAKGLSLVLYGKDIKIINKINTYLYEMKHGFRS